jgi:Zn-dependent peptidase ImmA (M78 family)
VNGDRLLLARKRAGLSLRALADKLENLVTPQAIGRYERNEITPSAPVLEALSHALNVEVAFLEAESGVRLGKIDYRKRSGTSAAERAAVEGTVLEQIEPYLLVEELLGLDSANWKFEELPVRSMEEAEKAAEETRRFWQLGEGPILSLTELLEEQGLKVIFATLPNNVSGLTCFVQRGSRKDVPVVVVNRTHGLERRRMTLAHELAHRCISVVGDLDSEKAANRFAGALLQPAPHVRREVGTHRQGFGVVELMQTKQVYRVSAAALLVRFRDLGIISPETMVYIFQTVGRTWRTTEPSPIKEGRGDEILEAPRRFQRLCYRALAERLLTKETAAELLRTTVRSVEKAMAGQA